MPPKKRVPHSPKKLKAAIEEIASGKSVSQVSREFKIPRTTLLYKFEGKRPQDVKKPGPSAVLGDETESKICRWIISNAEKGFPINKQGIIFTVKKIVEEGKFLENQNIPFKSTGPGRKWFNSFMKRHPELSERHAEYLHKARTYATEPSIRKWFNEVRCDLEENVGILDEPRRVFNCDETAIYLHPKSGPVIAMKGQKDLYDVSKHSNKECLSVLITANANGEIAPPLALFSYERIPKIIAAMAPKDWGIGRSVNGWMTCECFFEYIANVFYPYIVDKEITLPVILFLDGHKSHSSLPLTEFCKERGIILICLHPNSTHILQPLDVSFFAPLKMKWKKELTMYKYKNGGKEIQKHDVTRFLDDILKRDDFRKTLKNGFRSCGLCPFDPNAVNYKKFKSRDNSPTEETPESLEQNEMKSDSEFLKQLEFKIGAQMMTLFLNTFYSKSVWGGEVEYTELFNLWQKCKMETDSIENSDCMLIDFPEFDLPANISKSRSDTSLAACNSMDKDCETENGMADVNIIRLQISDDLIADLDQQLTYRNYNPEPLPLNRHASPLDLTEREALPTESSSQVAPDSLITNLGLPSLDSGTQQAQSDLSKANGNQPQLDDDRLDEDTNLIPPSLDLGTQQVQPDRSKGNGNQPQLDDDRLDEDMNLISSNLNSESQPAQSEYREANGNQPQLDASRLDKNTNSISPCTPISTNGPPIDDSSGKSVDEILDSVFRFRNETKETVKSVRKKLKLPSVMTTQKWIDLQTAQNAAKADKENFKRKKRKDRENAKKNLMAKKQKTKIRECTDDNENGSLPDPMKPAEKNILNENGPLSDRKKPAKKNKNILQRRKQSVRKNNRTKPVKKENDSSESDDAECLICSGTFKKSKPNEQWIRCLSCANWCHEKCSDSQNDDFVCDLCQ